MSNNSDPVLAVLGLGWDTILELLCREENLRRWCRNIFLNSSHCGLRIAVLLLACVSNTVVELRPKEKLRQVCQQTSLSAFIQRWTAYCTVVCLRVCFWTTDLSETLSPESITLELITRRTANFSFVCPWRSGTLQHPATDSRFRDAHPTTSSH